MIEPAFVFLAKGKPFFAVIHSKKNSHIRVNQAYRKLITKKKVSVGFLAMNTHRSNAA